MEKWVRAVVIGLIATPICFLFLGCNGKDEPSAVERNNQTETNTPMAKGNKIPTLKSDDHVLVFVDKSNSIDPKKQFAFTDDHEKEIKSVLEGNGGKLTIYFIHKNLASASFHFEKNFEKPDTKDMVAMKAKMQTSKFSNSLDSIDFIINEAIKFNINANNSGETDMWITVKKISDKFSKKPSNSRLHVVYISDMIESVLNTSCGKNYHGKKITTVADAQKLAKQDYPAFEKCYNLKSLPNQVSVMMYFPTDANPDKNYANIHEYWKALFGLLGITNVDSNLF